MLCQTSDIEALENCLLGSQLGKGSKYKKKSMNFFILGLDPTPPGKYEQIHPNTPKK